jgi:membrane associated rhomboid family serine protease
MLNIKNFFRLNSLYKLIILNIIFFIVSFILILIKIETKDYLALNPSNIFHKYYFWTLITSMFMHSNLFHLLLNMLSLFFVGNILIKILGEKRFVSLYLLSGIFSGVFFILSSLIFPSEFNVYAVGASGAIFGLIGVLICLTPDLPVYIMFVPVPIKMKYAAPLMLIILWVISLLGNIPIGNAAHLGGLLYGLGYGLYLTKKFKKKSLFIKNYFR